MKILIIGKHGQLAQSLIKQLEHLGKDYTALSQDELDITQPEKCIKVIKKINPSIIINTAAYNLVQQAEIHPFNAFSLNTFAVNFLSKLCKENRIRLITFSTDYVFDGTKNTPYLEADQPNPLQMYGLSKYAGEIACKNENPDSIIIRTNGLYGGLNGSPQKNGNFVLNILREAKKKKVIEVSDLFRVNPTYSDDLATAVLNLLNNRDAKGLYHLASEGSCTWYDFATEIVNTLAIDTVVVRKELEFNVDVNRPHNSVLRNSRAKSIGITLPKWKKSLCTYLVDLQNEITLS